MPSEAPLVDDPWVSDPSSSTARQPSPSSSQSSNLPGSRIRTTDSPRPTFRDSPSTEDPLLAWNRDDPLSSNSAISHVNIGPGRGTTMEADIHGVQMEDNHIQTLASARQRDAAQSQAESTREGMATLQPSDSCPSKIVPHNKPKTSISPSHLTPSIQIDYNYLHTLCAAGDVKGLETFFTWAKDSQRVPYSVLANTHSPTSGLLPIHYAAKEGKVEALRWLIQEAGGSVNATDREGETALHKAALAGKLLALTYLLSISSIEADATDADGWTPLHNACSKGYLDIVKALISTASSSPELRGGRGGWTSLMNAASNGHLPIVRFLTAKCHVDPFIRNSSGETAFDVAAAKFEVYICEVLEAYEVQKWTLLRHSTAFRSKYNPLRLHVTVPVIIHQNERLDARLSTLALYGGKPQWSGTGAGRPGEADRRAPGTMPPGPLSTSRYQAVPMRREDVQTPTRRQPYRLRLPPRRHGSGSLIDVNAEVSSQNGEDMASTPTRQSVLQESRRNSEESSHFWLSEWQVDRTHPLVDPREGWQYAQSFDAPEETWSAQMPAPLVRLVEGKGVGASFGRALAGPASRSGSGTEEEVANTRWVRRRRWVRVLRRRLDIDFGDELEAAENVSCYRGDADANASQFSLADRAKLHLDKIPASASYLERARALADVDEPDNMGDEEMARHSRIVRLELALAEIRLHAFEDNDEDRQAQAKMLLQDYNIRLGGLRRATYSNQDLLDSDDEDPDDAFIYPHSFEDTQSAITRPTNMMAPIIDPSSARASRETPRETSSEHSARRRPSTGTPKPVSPASEPTPLRSRLTASSADGQIADGGALAQQRATDLARASEFRVPTNEAPQSQTQFSSRPHTVLQPTSLAPTWEPDEMVQTCRSCSRRFTFFTRKHHCRRCGRIFCNECSSQRAQLSADELVIDPAQPEMFLSESMGGLSRVCNDCGAERLLPEALRSNAARSLIASSALTLDSTASSTTSSATSHASQLTECPVCNTTLAALGSQTMQEIHLQTCLETGGGGGGAVEIGRYLVYRLPAESPIMGRECVICLEELDLGQMIARLPCLCFFHRTCIDSWLARGRSCPTHAR